MKMSVAIRLVLACALGVCTALLLACGGGGSAGLLSSANAGPLSSDFDAVAAAVAARDCAATGRALRQTVADLGNLPASTDAGLRQRLTDGVRNLARHAASQCAQTTSTASTASTATSTTTTATTPTTTTTTPTTPTTTTTTTPTTTTTTTPTTSTETSTGGGVPAPGANSGDAAGGASPGASR